MPNQSPYTHHHDRLFLALCDEIDELAPADYDTKNARYLWGKLQSDGDRRTFLREYITLLRDSRLAMDLHLLQNLAYPMRLATHLGWYRDVFRGTPQKAAHTLAELVEKTLLHETVIKRLAQAKTEPNAKLRFISQPTETRTVRAYRRTTKILAQSMGEVDADMAACTYRAAGMEWDDFITFLEEEQTRLLELLYSMPETDQQNARVARVIAALEAVPARVIQINQEDGAP